MFKVTKDDKNVVKVEHNSEVLAEFPLPDLGGVDLVHLLEDLYDRGSEDGFESGYDEGYSDGYNDWDERFEQ